MTPQEINGVVKSIIKAYAYQIYVIGFWNSDPHPGNFLVSKQDGSWKPYLLDFGLTKRATKKELMGLSQILLSASNVDFTSLLSGFQEIGLKVNVDDPDGSMEVIKVELILGGLFKLTLLIFILFS